MVIFFVMMALSICFVVSEYIYTYIDIYTCLSIFNIRRDTQCIAIFVVNIEWTPSLTNQQDKSGRLECAPIHTLHTRSSYRSTTCMKLSEARS